MFSKKLFKGFTLVAFSAVFSLSTIQSAYARPGTLATAPLFLSSIVEPNVFFTHDDSGSMNWEMMVQTGTGGFTSTEGLPMVGASLRYYSNPDWYTDSLVLPPVSLFADAWILRNHNGNKNYYNPAIKYAPWGGTDGSGNPMYSHVPGTLEKDAPLDPNNPTGTKTDLTTWKNFYDYDFCNCYVNNSIYLPTYYEWIDSDGDGIIETTDGKNRVEIVAGTPEMENFANWYVYYRSREYAAKAAIGRVINNTDASRMGLDVFNAGHKVDVESMSVPANKTLLLDTFYKINASGGTPARNALRRVGKLFEKSSGNAPILSATLGGECQQNFNILLSDGFWNGGNPGGISNEDSDTGGFNDTIFDGGSYADAFSDTLADVAMYYYENDLRNLADNVPTQPGIDEADHQHLVTYTIAFGLNGTLDSTSDPTTVTWPDPTLGGPQKVDDMWHAAYNGRGKYLSAQNPVELENSLNDAIADIAERTATAAAVSINSTQLNTDTVVYLAEFNTNRWQGDLKAFKIQTLDPNNTPLDLTDDILDPSGALNPTAEWSAATQLNARWNSTLGTLNPDREIMTYDGSQGIRFLWGDLTAGQQNDLRINPNGLSGSILQGQQRVDYLRGDRSLEGTVLRERLSLLGDLVNSGPVYVGKPALNWPDVAPFPTGVNRYSDFKTAQENRLGVIYAASNDGMLHGFRETDGEEVMAYIPNNLFSAVPGEGMHYLTDQNYGHAYFNDLTPTLSDVFGDIRGSGAQWNTVLINGERGGGRGIYALNVNNPLAMDQDNAANIVLWEFTDNDLGYTFSQPQIAYTGSKWVAIFGNGYNTTGDGNAKLFIVDIIGGSDGTWDAGEVVKIDTGVGAIGDPNGLSTPRLADLDGDGTVDRAWAGDLYGNMWAFDIGTETVAGSAPLFTTIGGINEPITEPPALAKHPTISDDGSNDPNVMVYFGTGQYLVNSDKTSTDLNHFYGIWDNGTTSVTAGQLEKQTYVTGFTDSGGNAVRVLTNNVVNYAGGEFGWHFELDETGEKSFFVPVVRGGIVFFTTFTPNPDPCSSGGSSYLFSVDMINGGSPDEPQIDTNNDGIVDDNDRVNNGGTTGVMAARKSEGLAPNPVFVDDIAYTGATPTKVKKLKKIPEGRFSWQEITP